MTTGTELVAGAELDEAGCFVGEEEAAFEEVEPGAGLGESDGGVHGTAVGVDLPDFEEVAGADALVHFQGDEAFEEVGLGRLGDDYGEVGLVVDGLDFGDDFLAGFGFFDFDVGGVGDELGGGEDAVAGDECAECGA